MLYFYTDQRGQVWGPVPETEFASLASSGQVNGCSLVVPVGEQQWRPISTILPGLKPPKNHTELLGIISFILGLSSFVCCGLAVGLAAVICGHVAMLGYKKRPDLPGEWLAIVGTVLGYLGFAACVLYWAAMFVYGYLKTNH